MRPRLDFAWGFGAVGCAWLLGVVLHLQLGELPAAVVLGAAAAAVAMLLVLGVRWRVCRVFAALLLGFTVSCLHAAARLADELPSRLEGEDVELTGVVAGLPQVMPNGLRFRFDVSVARWNGHEVQVPRHVLLGWYVGWPGAPAGVEGPAAAPPALRAGEVWQLTARLRRPHGLRNPHGFDAELSLFEQGVRATGSVRPKARPQARAVGASSAYPVQWLRQHTRDSLYEVVPDPRAAGVLAALCVGDQSAIERDDWQVFRDTGVAHLMSISGMHVTMFAWLVGGLLRWMWCRSGRLCLRVPAPVAGRLGGLAAALAYALFAGWGVPAQRTVWMLATVTLLHLGGRRWPHLLVLLAAALVVSVLDPWALLQAGFWLSFAAVALLLVSGTPDASATLPATTRAGQVRAVLAAGLRTQAVATVGLTPLSLVLFQQVSVVGVLANLVAIPLVTLVTTPLALLGVVWSPLWALGAAVVQATGLALQALAHWPIAVWVVPAAPAWAQAAGLLGAAVAVMPLPWRLRLLAVPLMLPLSSPQPMWPAHGRYELLAADVGQGTAVLVRTARHLLVYDTGPQYSQDSNAGDRVLLPLLRARGETRIDRLVLSHRDTDHVGGAAPLFDALPVDELMSSLEPGHALLGRAHADRRCDAGQSWAWDGVTFEVLHPPAADHARPLRPNARSCVVRVHAAQGTALLAGDIERDQEARLVAAGAPLRSDVLLVPHHGSRTSSTAAFLDAVRPQVAVIQAGHRNRFGHPVDEVLVRLRERGAAVVISPACGAWHWAGDGRPAVAARCVRPDTFRYWQSTGLPLVSEKMGP